MNGFILALALIISTLTACAAPRLGWVRRGNNIVFGWQVEKSARYQLRYGTTPGDTRFILYTFDSCEVGWHNFTMPIPKTGNRFVRLISGPNFRRCP